MSVNKTLEGVFGFLIIGPGISVQADEGHGKFPRRISGAFIDI